MHKRSALVSFSLGLVACLLLAGCASSPDTAEEAREVSCREQAQRECASAVDVDSCVGKRAWDCDLGQTPDDMQQRAEIPVEGAAPEAPAVINPSEAEGNSYPGYRWDNP